MESCSRGSVVLYIRAVFIFAVCTSLANLYHSAQRMKVQGPEKRDKMRKTVHGKKINSSFEVFQPRPNGLWKTSLELLANHSSSFELLRYIYNHAHILT